MSDIIYVNGTYVEKSKATISPFDRGFLFGDALYEVVAFIDGKLLEFDRHFSRLERGLSSIDMKVPFTRQEYLDIHQELIRKNSYTIGGVYTQISRGVSERDFVYPDDCKATVVGFIIPINYQHGELLKHGIAVVTCPDIRWKRRDIKSTNLLAQVMAKKFAQRNNAKETWMLEDGFVTEGASSSAYIVKGNKLITRALSNLILAGTTREGVLACLANLEYKLEERKFTLDEALKADEAFITSAGNLIAAVKSIDGHVIGDGKVGPFTRQLGQHYFSSFNINL